MDVVPAIMNVSLLLIGIGLGVGALLMSIQSLRRLILWDSAVGEIIGFKREESYFMPQVRYMSRTGEVIEFTSQQGRGVRGYRKGEPVVVLYDAGTPQNAEIRSFSRLWLFPVCLAGFAAVFILGTLSQMIS